MFSFCRRQGTLAVSDHKWKSRCRVQLFATPRTIQLIEFSRPEYRSGLPSPSPGELPNPGLEPRSPMLQADSLPAEPLGSSKITNFLVISLHWEDQKQRGKCTEAEVNKFRHYVEELGKIKLGFDQPSVFYLGSLRMSWIHFQFEKWRSTIPRQVDKKSGVPKEDRGVWGFWGGERGLWFSRRKEQTSFFFLYIP